MAQVIRYVVLAVALVGLGWKVYTLVFSAPPEAEAPKVLMVGDPESAIGTFYGSPVGISGKAGVDTHYFKSAEVDVQDGLVVAIRDQKGVTGTLKYGEQKVVVDENSRIGEQ